MSETPQPSRKEFLLALAGGALLSQVATAQPARGKLLIVTAHPDDEYAFAAVVYRLVRECGWSADQIVITNGESGYRYATLAETFYGVSLGRYHRRACESGGDPQAGSAQCGQDTGGVGELHSVARSSAAIPFDGGRQ